MPAFEVFVQLKVPPFEAMPAASAMRLTPNSAARFVTVTVPLLRAIPEVPLMAPAAPLTVSVPRLTVVDPV